MNVEIQNWKHLSRYRILNVFSVNSSTLHGLRCSLTCSFYADYQYLVSLLPSSKLRCIFNTFCLISSDTLRLKLENNLDIIDQLNILSSLTVNISSCVLYDRIRAAETTDEMEREAERLSKSNELFGSKCSSLYSNWLKFPHTSFIQNSEESL